MLENPIRMTWLLPCLAFGLVAAAQDRDDTRRDFAPLDGGSARLGEARELDEAAADEPLREERHRSGEREPPALRPENSLMITDLRVIEDPVRTDPRQGERGAWSFRYLIENMAGDRDPSRFVMDWLATWEQDQFFDGLALEARPRIRELVIEPWLRRSGGRRLDLDLAPFRLLAIVNRMDLREHDGEAVASAGEGRFVFGLLGPDGRPLAPVAGPAPGGFVLIFEYGLPARDMGELRRWAEDWARLSELPLGSRDYRDALERVTRGFTDRGRAPGKPNGSALNQLRTNEISLAAPWELREFVIGGASGLLEPHSVANTPDTVELNGTDELTRLINDNADALLDGSFVLDGALFGASSLSGPFSPADFPDFAERSFVRRELAPGILDIPWSAAGIESNDARHAFAVNTCGGCHRAETGTGFVMVGFPAEHELPERLGRPAALAGFLTGIEVPDPVDPGTLRSFDDLERRRLDLQGLLRSFGGDRPREGGRHPHRVH